MITHSRNDALPLIVGTKIRFTTAFGLHPGTRNGTIVARMVANPNGFFPDGNPYYDVKVFIPSDGQHAVIAVMPNMIHE